VSVTRLQLVSVPVSDQDQTRTFYVDTPGFELGVSNLIEPDQRWVLMESSAH
jgi:catechol 2,3-dioxygenase-like lactoylglutathione lyase family enzyme